ncbi:MAG: ribonuclease III domain-containing protein [Bacilli bacterium]|nr:ribonuclease III domain-containing protein [Bacilli bacterium]
MNLIDKYLNLNPTALAYLGDSVYELNIRKYLISKNIVKVNDLQKEATKYVSAKSQFRILNDLINENKLTNKELEIIKKGRNTKGHRAPKNTDIVTYRSSTGFESLIGYLYLFDTKRLNELMKEIIGE